ncbi:MAG: threonine/serine dehydratase [Gemmatimonadaceae bacterium]|nr:threonine/serine dehydratase [Gemmatimonadaceae bacterium]
MNTTRKTVVTLEDIRSAQETLAGVSISTPLLPDDELSRKFGHPISYKPEMLQRGGAFKFRGAYNFLANLSPEQRKRGVIAPSSGNHAQGVAMAAQLFGCPATVVMPTTVTAPKKNGAERLGARVELAGTTTDDRYGRALELSGQEGSVMVPPYDDLFIIAGQGTVGLEILADMKDVATVVVPVGGGGLSAGVAAAIKLSGSKARVIGVEPTGAQKLTRARAAGKPVRLESTKSLADGLMAVQVGDITFAHHQQFIDDVVTISDDDLLDAMRHLINRMKLVVEPSGAITLAALLTGAVSVEGPTVVVLSGGNIEWDGLVQLLG